MKDTGLDNANLVTLRPPRNMYVSAGSIFWHRIMMMRTKDRWLW